MLFLNRTGVSTLGVPVHSIGTSQADCHQTQVKQEPNSKPDTANKKAYSSKFFSKPNPLRFLKTTLTTLVISFTTLKSSALIQLGFNETEKLLHRAALPTSPQDKVTLQQEIQEELKPFVWGKKGLIQESIIQRKDNCQVMASLLASTFTEERKRRLESLVNITNYNLDKNNFYINFTVNINGKKIPVSYKNLISDIIGLENTNDPLAPHALAYAIEKELTENYLPNPSGYTALSSATFLTNQSYSTLKLLDLSDSSLIEVLQQAPKESIMVGTKNIYNYSKLPSKNWVDVEHEYAVKSYKYENGQHLITLLAYKQEVTLTLEQLRESMFVITAPTKAFKLVDEETLQVYLLSLLALAALWKIIGKLENKITDFAS